MANFRPLDLVVLNTFVAVVDKGGFTAAADTLHLAQSTVSAHMKRLEETFGQPLLQRRRKASIPTPAGERLLSHARQMLRQNALAWQDVSDQRLDGVVRLGIPDDYVIYLPEALSEFESQYPGVELQVDCGLSVDLVQSVRAGSLDLAITTRQPKSPGGEVLCQEPTVWAGAPGHDTQRRTPLPLAVSTDGVCIFRERALAALDAVGLPWRIAYTSASLSGLTAAVRAGLAITVLTPSMLGSDLSIIDSVEGLPELPMTEIALHRSPGRPKEAARQLALSLQAHIQARSTVGLNKAAPA
ncbi:LysR substrate-binding domain-containing protein [Chromohalobacter sp. HP20-39]|uniref:LysR substrate-binding domain-containing protein n=1 Tax=Chromohalobacter sp. HP20-39 TaxID=3079306 RepID=UPI00294B50CE|nr:LysR substrate-binding domain-containing protein [Chromohalobacter sp. HP20-39]MDV6318248.1 LysR substrate-binding domain-containing protein [Chromohalobacter sp. HP20-39]